MRLNYLFLCLIILLPAQSRAEVTVPHEVGGFALGKRAQDYQSSLKMETVMPIRYRETIREIEIRPSPVFKSGLIWYGTCAAPDQIMRVRLKYRDSSEKLYKQLLGRFKKRFGAPAEWRGDPFHHVIGWKWSFKDAAGNRISLILQHNKMAEGAPIGNTVKLTCWNFIEAEEACALSKHPTDESAPKAAGSDSAGGQAVKDWDLYLPR